MKKALILMGSPRKSKNTNDILDFFIEGLDEDKFEVEKINLRDLKISNCTGCDYCGHKGDCTVKDDMEILYEKFDNSDLIVLGAPLYFNSVNGLTKNMIDRCQRYWSMKYSLGQNYKRGEDRIGIFLSVGGAPHSHDQFRGTIPVMDFFFKALNADYKGNYFISNTDSLPIKDRLDVKEELRSIGENIWDMGNFYIHK